MNRSKDILSGASLEFFNQKPSFWLRYGSLIILGSLLLLALFYSGGGDGKALSSPLIQEDAIQVEEVAVLLEEDVNNIEIFTSLDAQIEIGDTLFAFANVDAINNLQDFASTLSDEEESVNQKISAFKKMSQKDWPIRLEQEVKEIYEAMGAKISTGISKADKKIIADMETSVINSMKESQSIKKSLPKFEAMKDVAEKAFKEGKSLYGNEGISRSELESLKMKLEETKSYISLRKSSLEDHQRSITNFNRQIDYFKRKGNKQVLNLSLVNSRFDSLESALVLWMNEVYVISKTKGKLVEMISQGPSKKGDLLYTVVDESSSSNSDSKLMANFSNDFDTQILEGQGIILKVISDTFEKELLTTVKQKKQIGDDQFQILINPPDGLDFENTFITKGSIIIYKPKKSFLSKVWSNFT